MKSDIKLLVSLVFDAMLLVLAAANIVIGMAYYIAGDVSKATWYILLAVLNILVYKF